MLAPPQNGWLLYRIPLVKKTKRAFILPSPLAAAAALDFGKSNHIGEGSDEAPEEGW